MLREKGAREEGDEGLSVRGEGSAELRRDAREKESG